MTSDGNPSQLAADRVESSVIAQATEWQGLVTRNRLYVGYYLLLKLYLQSIPPNLVVGLMLSWRFE